MLLTWLPCLVYYREINPHLKGALHLSQTGVDFPDKSGGSLLLPVIPVENVLHTDNVQHVV